MKGHRLIAAGVLIALTVPLQAATPPRGDDEDRSGRQVHPYPGDRLYAPYAFELFAAEEWADRQRREREDARRRLEEQENWRHQSWYREVDPRH